MADTVRHQCARCYYASDTETVCPAKCCQGAQMLPNPDALLDSEIFTHASWGAQCEAEREASLG